jgi:hypothetical protein
MEAAHDTSVDEEIAENSPNTRATAASRAAPASAGEAGAVSPLRVSQMPALAETGEHGMNPPVSPMGSAADLAAASDDAATEAAVDATPDPAATASPADA